MPSADKKILSLIIPVYNEAGLIDSSLPPIIQLPIDKEVIVVDDGSSDGTGAKLEKLNRAHNFRLIRLDKNGGKGVAVRQGLAAATGSHFTICDADLEYNPADIISLFNEALSLNDSRQVIYGSRFKVRRPITIYYLFNIFITRLFNLLFKTSLSDVETCFKLVPLAAMDQITLESKRFEMELEITAKLIKSGYKIKELPIDYWPRKINEGKKIRVIDGFRAIIMALKQRFIR